MSTSGPMGDVVDPPSSGKAHMEDGNRQAWTSLSSSGITSEAIDGRVFPS